MQAMVARATKRDFRGIAFAGFGASCMLMLGCSGPTTTTGASDEHANGAVAATDNSGVGGIPSSMGAMSGSDLVSSGGVAPSNDTNLSSGTGSTTDQSSTLSSGGLTNITGGSTSVGGTLTDAGKSDPKVDAGGARPIFHVFLLLGQSKMAGYPQAQSQDKVEDARVQVLGYDDCSATGRVTDQWAVAVPPLHECWNGAIGPGDYFGKTVVDVITQGDTIGLVPCAISGEKIETFMKVGGTKYDWIIHRAQLAQQAGGVIEGILFHQGESNCGDPAWPGKVNTLVQDLRMDLGLGEVPFLAGELVQDGACSNHNTLVNQLPSIISNAYVVSSQGLVLDPADTQWNLHFDHDSQVTFGKRYAQTMMDALGW